jgi:hypothetical protein
MTRFQQSLTLLAVALWLGVTAQPALAQTAQTRQVMREKLELSQVLLGAVVTSNWASLDKTTKALTAVINRPGWQVLASPEYVQQTRAFLNATQALQNAGAARDQRTALTAYNSLVASCVECHRYVARARVARHGADRAAGS